MKPIIKDIKKAQTLDKEFYLEEAYFQKAKDLIFSSSWQWIGQQRQFNLDINNCHPFTLLDTYLDEPLLLSKNKQDEIKCLSNVCTHRGFLLMDHPCSTNTIRCKYHGRCFRLNGSFKSMPGFEEAVCLQFPGF
ncbi:MAG: Rieske 2Fe-2S domain-containing protein [Bacteroidota bacterium]